MVKMRMEDGQNYIVLTEGYLPNLEDQKTAHPRGMLAFRNVNPQFDSIEQSAAWIISARARQHVYYRAGNYGGVENVMKIPLDTYIIGPPKQSEGTLADWFIGQDRQSPYRLIVNRIPRQFNGVDFLEAPWGHVYFSLSKTAGGNRFHIQHRRGQFARLKPSGQTFLKELLLAYASGCERSYLLETGHSSWFSQGLPGKI